MVNMTLSIPEGLHKKMRRHSEFRWSDIARRAFEIKLRELALMEKILSKSRMTEEDAEIIGHKIKRGIARRYGLIR